MGINWINTRARSVKLEADLEVFYGKKSDQYTFSFSKGALATKLCNAPRIMIGADDSFTRLYFAPVTEKVGYKVTDARGLRGRLYVTGKKVAETFPTINPSTIIGTYNLKYDPIEDLHYISIGALPR